ncbi:MAG TPA: NosD domain-containing protein [Longimicrobiales bacterium]|nr:NosD domain-containing protein [Longimicrobiales bacterium]
MRNISRSLVGLIVLAGCTSIGDSAAPPSNPTAHGWSATLAASVSCGDVIVSDLRLENDLTCAGDGLTVSGSGIKIDLNGHTIAGAGTGVGVRVSTSHDVVIWGGTVRGFLQGMFLAASTGIVIKDNEFTQNATAVLLQASSGNSIKANLFRGNGLRAIMLRPNLAGVFSTNNDVVDNLFIDNPTGIFLIAQPGNTFKGNTISGSTVAAIDLAPAPLGASGNLIKGNLLVSSATGIRFAAGWTDNTILGNTIQANTCAFQGPSSGNTLQGNTLTANATDFCP